MAKSYSKEVDSALLEKKKFTKVEALESFMDFFFHGRVLGTMPSHNTYLPVGTTILPKPKFASYMSDDQVGRDYMYGQIPSNIY